MKSEIGEIIKLIKQFRDDRDWEKFHDAKNLAICLNIESSELLEIFLWKNAEDADIEKVKNELADVFYSAFLLADKYGFDIKEIILDKLKNNELKYPIGKSKGSNKKYTDFESDIEGSTQTTSMGTFEVTKVRIHDDLLQEGLKKKPAKSAASFVTIGEPDIILLSKQDLNDSTIHKIKNPAIQENPSNRVQTMVQVEIKGLDIYDPIKDEVKPRNVHDIAYWMVDEDYDGSNFVVKQVFFCGGDKSEFDKWKKGLDNLAKDSTKKKVEKTLKIEIDDEAFDRLYGHISHPIEIKKKGQKIAVRIISQFGEECTKVLTTE